MSTESKLLLGLAGAAMAGFIIGVMTAPCSGEETRTKIRQGTNDVANRLLNRVRSGDQTASQQIHDLIDSATAKYHETKGQVKAHTDEALNGVADLVDTAKAKYHEAKGYVKASV